MNKLLLSTALAAAFGVAALAPQAANASDGTITINGSVVASTCSVTVAGQTGSSTVTLPPATIAQLTPANTLVDVTPFTIKVSNCASYTTATPLFTSSATDAANGALTATNVGSANVTKLDLALVNSDGTTLLDLRQGEGTQGASAFTLTAGAGSANYNVAYYPTAAVTGAGKITAQATYTMIYQ